MFSLGIQLASKALASFALIILFLVFCFSFSSVHAQAQTQNITLYGSATQGWGFTQQSITSPGPQITFQEGQLVNLTLIAVDGLPHIFYVDYNGNKVADSNEPKSPQFTTTINYQFTPDRTGQFTYYCSIHPTVMFGNVSAIPEFTSTIAVLILIIASATIAVIYKNKKS